MHCRRYLPGQGLGVAGILRTQRGEMEKCVAYCPNLGLTRHCVLSSDSVPALGHGGSSHRYLAESREWREREQRNWAVSAQGRDKEGLLPRVSRNRKP